jgi:ubiquinone/menaquinone biosynthesis C-methylase UbiE
MWAAHRWIGVFCVVVLAGSAGSGCHDRPGSDGSELRPTKTTGLPDVGSQQFRSNPDYDDPTIQGMLSPERVRLLEPDRVIQTIPVEPGMTVADIGCGPGLFTFRLARAVGPRGSVFAVDIQQSVLAVVRQRLDDPDENPFGNVRVVHNTPDSLTLAPNSLDVALLSQVHIFNYPTLLPENVAFMNDIRACVKPGGRVAVLEARAKTGNTTAVITGHFETAGFVVDRVFDAFNEHVYLLVFSKPADER